MSSLILLWFVLSADTSFAIRKGGTFHFIAPYGICIDTLDPGATTNDKDLSVIMNIHRGLYGWDAEKNEVRLEIAESVKVSDDGRTYTFTLRDVKFSNGKQMTADDVLFTYNRMADPANGFPTSYWLESIVGGKDVIEGKAKTISGVKKIDSKTVSITFKNAVDASYKLWRSNFSIQPETTEPKEHYSQNPVGLGPFMLEKWVKGSKLILKRNPYYYRPGKPYLDELVIFIMPDSATRDMAFEADELDANILFSSQYAKLQKNPELKKYSMEVPEMFTRGIRYNPNLTLADGRKPLADKRVRQAINYSINYDAYIKKYSKNKAYPCVGFLAPSTPGFNPDGFRYEYNPTKAKQLMREAGYEDGFPLTIEGGDTEFAGTPAVTPLLPFLRAINIQPKLQRYDSGSHAYDRYLNGEYEAAITAHNSGPDALAVMARFHSNNPRFKKKADSCIKIPAFDKVYDLAIEERDPKKKKAYIALLDGILTEEAVMVFLNYSKAAIAFKPWVHGMYPVGVEMMLQEFDSVWVDSSSPRAN